MSFSPSPVDYDTEEIHYDSKPGIDLPKQPPILMSETQTLEKMVDDIANKLQESADDIITVHVSPFEM